MEKEKRKISKLAIFSFILSIVPIIMLIVYGIVRTILFKVPVLLLWYNLIVEIIPFISLVLSILAIIIIWKKKTRGIGFAISALIISIIESALFLTIITDSMG